MTSTGENDEYHPMSPTPEQIQQTARKRSRKANRIMDREGKFHQSKGRWNIRRIKSTKEHVGLYSLDPFHSIVNLGTPKVLAILFSCYIFSILIYAGMYLAIGTSCQMGIENFVQAMYFSVETLITIGYGAPKNDVFFDDCASPLILITSQSLLGVFFDSLAIGTIFQRFSRAHPRANTIIFSRFACIRRIRGHLYFMAQACELRKHQLVEAHVRCYAIRHDISHEGDHMFQSYPMRLQHPDDELGGMMLMALPSVIVHRLDSWSPLIVKTSELPSCGQLHEPSMHYLFPEPLQREADAEAGQRDLRGVDSGEHLRQRDPEPIYNCSEHCIEHSHEAARTSHSEETENLLRYWEEVQLEIVVLIEGIDAATSATIQARHSYKPHEILMDHVFENCVNQDDDGRAVVNFNQFHAVRPLDFACINVRGSFY